MNKEDIGYILGVLLIVAAMLGGIYYDEGALSPGVLLGDLIDKEARTTCAPIMVNSNSMPVGESCSTDYLLYVRSGGRVKTFSVTGRIYGDFAVGDRIQQNWNTGRLGFRHDIRYSHPAID
jgi:hypothetical protein